MEGLYRSWKNKGESWDQLCPWAPSRSLLQRRAGSGRSICWVEKCLILELAPCEWREDGHAVGLGSLSLSLGRGAVSEPALVGTSVLLAGWCGWSGFHPLSHQRSVIAVGIWLLASITNLHLLPTRSSKLV